MEKYLISHCLSAKTPAMCRVCSITLIIFLSLTVILEQTHGDMDNTVVMEAKPKQYCSFFQNRAPEIQLGLKNCTWFKENSCCRQKEIDAIFGRVKPLRGASPACQRFTNYLMCYICAPNQNTFYMRESLTVCEEFCDAWYDACQTAILKGSVIRGLYPNGSEYCKSRRFIVKPAAEQNCFFFDAKQDTLQASKAITLKGLVLCRLSDIFSSILCLSLSILLLLKME